MDEKTKNILLIVGIVVAVGLIIFILYYIFTQSASQSVAQSVQSTLDAAQQKLITDLTTKQNTDLISLKNSINLIEKQIKNEDVLTKLNELKQIVSDLSTKQGSDNKDRSDSINALSGTVSTLSTLQESDNTARANAITSLSGTVSTLSTLQVSDNTSSALEIGALIQSLNTLNDKQKTDIANVILSITNLTKTQLDDIGIINGKFDEIRGLINSNQTSLRQSLSTNEIRITAKDGSIWKVIIDNNGKLCFNHLDYLVCLDDIQYNMDQIIAQKQKQKQKQ